MDSKILAMVEQFLSLCFRSCSCVCECVQKSFSASTYIYHSLVKERAWVEHLTSLPKTGMDVLLSVSAFNHKRVPMYVSIAHKFAEMLDER